MSFQFFIFNFKFSKAFMPLFIYSAVNFKGNLINGEIEAGSREAALESVKKENSTVISIKQRQNSRGALSSFGISSLSAMDKIMLTKNLSLIIKAGLSLKEGLDTLLCDTRKKMLAKLLMEAKSNLEKGQPLSYTFRRYPNYFSKVFIALLEAGEVSGTLEKSLDYLGVEIEKEYKMKQKVRNAMIYPAILLLASAAVIAILMVLVIPKLTKVFFQNNLDLPWSTRMIMGISEFLGKNIAIILISFIIFLVVIILLRNKKFFQFAISSMTLKTPVASDLYRKIIIARFTRTLGVLLASGISILKALDISSEVIGYNQYRDDLKKIMDETGQGSSLGASLKRRGGEFPFLVINMVTVGEKTGKLDSVLGELALFYEEEVDNELKNIITLIEPLLVLIMGLIVGAIAFSIIIPIYQIMGTVG